MQLEKFAYLAFLENEAKIHTLLHAARKNWQKTPCKNRKARKR